VSRAIGDINLKPFVTCEPEIMAVEMSADDMFLVLATDGIWCVYLCWLFAIQYPFPRTARWLSRICAELGM